ncbi:MAG: MarR family winged helix-turn-helix transcriptional regulator [Rhodoferax sp.]|nr:MarR family winged helix-turn-helix transcriptional regulator [Rhodoferax sp.]
MNYSMILDANLKNTRLLRFRVLIHKYLGINSSLIPFDILLLVMMNDGVQNVTIKSLLAGLTHSQTGVRYHLKRLIAEDWLLLHKGEADKRNTFVTLTASARRALELAEQQASLEHTEPLQLGDAENFPFLASMSGPTLVLGDLKREPPADS